MFDKPFHKRVRERRTARGLSQQQAADLCNLSRARWSDLELGRRRPSTKEFQSITNILRFNEAFVPPPGVVRKLLDQGARLTLKQKPYFGHQDRPTYIRFATLRKRYPREVDALARLAKQRTDLRLCEQTCHQIPCDSCLEAFFLLYLQAVGAKPCLLAPSSLGRLPHVATSCDGAYPVDLRPRPCFVLEDTYYFFQVSFRVSRLIRVDVLKWSAFWSVVEFDGEGHNSYRDSIRDSELGIPVKRINQMELLEIVGKLLKNAA